MRKLLAVTALSLMSFTAMAGTSISITSFVYTNNEGKVAEICGLVKDSPTPVTNVQIVVDYNSKRPGTYNTIAGSDGKFCTVVVSYFGTAKASTF